MVTYYILFCLSVYVVWLLPAFLCENWYQRLVVTLCPIATIWLYFRGRLLKSKYAAPIFHIWMLHLILAIGLWIFEFYIIGPPLM